MADRTAAALFGRIFEYLAETPDDRSKAFAKELYEMAGDYDFSRCHQMACSNDSLRALGLPTGDEDD